MLNTPVDWLVATATVCAGPVAGATWIPSTYRAYVERYFPGMRHGPLSPLSVAGLGLAHVAVLGAAAPYLGQLALVGVGLMSVALQGVVQLDRKLQVIPDRFQVVGLLGAICYATDRAATSPSPSWQGVALSLGLVAALWALSAGYERLRRRPAMGLGDLKMLGWFAVACGVDVVGVIFLACLLAIVGLVPRLLRRDRGAALGQAFAFGPHLALAFVVVVATGLTQL